MTSNGQILAIVAAAAAATFLTRVFPFLLFSGGKKTPETVLYLGRVLPPAIIAFLVVYCLKGVTLLSAFPFGLPEAIAVLLVTLLHVWKKNNLLSILGGTVVYMLLVQVVFA